MFTATKKYALSILSRRELITEPGEYRLTCSRDPFFIAGNRKILNFLAVTPDMQIKVDQHMKAKEYQEAINTNLDIIWERGTFLSCKDSTLMCTIEYTTLEDDTRALRITSVRAVDKVPNKWTGRLKTIRTSSHNFS